MTFDPAFTWAALISSFNFLSIWTMFAVVSRQHRAMNASLTLAKLAAADAATGVEHANGRLEAVAVELKATVIDGVTQVKSDALDAAAVLALSTPDHAVLPADLRRVVVVGTAPPGDK